jgi:hypothetical protein
MDRHAERLRANASRLGEDPLAFIVDRTSSVIWSPLCL